MADGGGLSLLVAPSGGKLWRFKYRYGGKEKNLSCGVFPDVSLDEARAQRDRLRKLLSHGIDPSVVRKEEKARAKATALATRDTSTVRVSFALDGPLEIWKGRAVVRLTSDEALSVKDLLNKLIPEE